VIYKSGWQTVANDHIAQFPNLRGLRGHWVKLKITELGAKAVVDVHDWNLCQRCHKGQGKR
jgi:hypothetical protein